MARKVPLITDQILALEQENEKLRGLQKILDKVLKMQFGLDCKGIQKLIDESKNRDSKSPRETVYTITEPTDFEKSICAYFDLFYSSDKDNFLQIILSDNVLDFYKKRLNTEDFLNNSDTDNDYNGDSDTGDYETFKESDNDVDNNDFADENQTGNDLEKYHY